MTYILGLNAYHADAAACRDLRDTVRAALEDRIRFAIQRRAADGAPAVARGEGASAFGRDAPEVPRGLVPRRLRVQPRAVGR